MVSNSGPKVIGSQLEHARKSLSLSIDEVASRTGIQPGELYRWESESGEPSIEQLWDLARIYHRSTDYFLRHTPEFPDRLNFRLTKQRQLGELPVQAREAIVRFEELCRSEYELEKLLGRPKRLMIDKITTEITPEELASRERKRLKIGSKPIRDIRGLLEQMGVRVFFLPIKEKELSGMSWWHIEYGPCILVNAYDEPLGRRAFTMAHEYSHLVRGHLPIVCDLKFDAPEEHYANIFASSFLIPASDLAEEFKKVVGIQGTLPSSEQLGVLASRYSVSLEALSRRLEYVGIIPQGSTDRYIAEWSSKPRPRRGAKGPLWKRQLGSSYVSLALDAYSRGGISLGKLSQYLGVDVRTALDTARGETEKGRR